MDLKVISLGGGVQSTAMVVLAAQGKIDFQYAVMSNVGNDSENPATITYVDDVLIPWAAERGIEVVIVNPAPYPSGDERTLYKQIMSYNGCQLCGRRNGEDCAETCPSHTTERSATRDLPIPIYIQPSNAPVQRSCTNHFKVIPITKWLESMGATDEEPATVALGISTDEIQRASGRGGRYQRVVYPLLDLGLNRSECRNLIANAGLPVPPKSTCWFCPFHKVSSWAEIRRDQPERFARVVEMENHLIAQRRELGRAEVHLSRLGRPLETLAEAGPTLPGFEYEGSEGCDEGHCWT